MVIPMKTPDTLSLIVTRDQAERLLALVDAENAAQKNRCVGALNPVRTVSTDGPDAERVERAIALALDSAYLTTLRASIQRRLNGTMARTAAEHLSEG
jgi:hypothetical protein